MEKYSHHVCGRVLFLISHVIDFKVKVKVESRLLCASCILYFKLILIDAMQIIIDSRIVQLQNIIYVAEVGIKGQG